MNELSLIDQLMNQQPSEDPPPLLKLLAILMGRSESQPTRPNEGPPLPTRADRNRQTLGPHMQELVSSPFFQDTVLPWLGVNPSVRQEALRDGTVGVVRFNDPNTIVMANYNEERLESAKRFANESYFAERHAELTSRETGSTLSHEAMHVSDLLKKPVTRDLRMHLRRAWQERRDKGTHTTIDARARDSVRESTAYTLESALQQLRIHSGKDLPADEIKEFETRFPGWKFTYDWLRNRGQEVETLHQLIREQNSGEWWK